MLARILFDDHAAHNIPLPPARDIDVKAQTFLPVTRSIPVEHLYESYVTAMEEREPGVNFLISGIEMLNAWKGTVRPRREREAESRQKRLPENAAAACGRCLGTGWERMPDGSVRLGCRHVPLDESAEAERARIRERDANVVREQTEFMREALKKIGSPKPPPAEVQPKRQQGTPLYCTNPECGRSKRAVSSLFFAEGGTCGELLNRGDYDDPAEMKLCDGVFINREGAI